MADAVDYRKFILGHVAAPLAALGMDPATIPDDLDLLATGLIDSLGILELVSAIETEFAIEVDYFEIAPEDLTTLGPLSKFLAAQSN